MREHGGVTSFDQMPEEKPQFLEWTAHHPSGYVLNQLTEKHFLLHHADCESLKDIHPESLAKPKHCAEERDLLLQLPKGESPERCPNCFG